MGQSTTLNYSPRGELISIIDPFGEKIELVYQRGMLKEAKSYDGTSVKYAYNADKQLSTVTYEDGTSTTYKLISVILHLSNKTFDKLNRGKRYVC